MPQNDLLFQWRTILDNVCLYGEIHHQKKEMRQTALRRWRVSGWQDVKINIRMSSPAVCASAPLFFVRRCVRRGFIFWMSHLAHWMSSRAAICRTGFESSGTGLHRTILLVTHDTDEAIYLSDRILILGAPGEGIRQEIAITEQNRSREWLYERES